MKTALVILLLAFPALADDAGSPAEDGGVPVACDGALCDTTNGSGCGATAGLDLLALAAVAGLVRRRARS